MRVRIALAAAVLGLTALTGCGDVVNFDPLSPDKPVSINDSAALKLALEKAGINKDVRVVDTTDGSIAVWASVPKFENCPILWTVENGQYRAAKLHKQDGQPADLKALQAQPTLVDIGLFAAQNGNIFAGCQGADKKPNPLPSYGPEGPNPAK